MKQGLEEIPEFWAWFQARRAEFDALTETNDPFWDVALERLRRFDGKLWFELSDPNGKVREFIVTSGGQAEVFQLADTIVAHAPPIPGMMRR